MTFQEMKNLVASWVDDLNFGYFTESQVEAFLNNGLKEAQKRLIQAGENYYMKVVCTPVIANQQDYQLPIDFMATRRVEMISGTSPNQTVYPLAPITPMEAQAIVSSPGEPSAYWLKKNRLVLDRPYNTSGVRELKLYYDYFVANMTMPTDTPDLPERYQEYPCVLATLDCLYKDNRPVQPMLDKKNYYETLMKQDAERRTRDYPRMIIATQDDAYWSY